MGKWVTGGALVVLLAFAVYGIADATNAKVAIGAVAVLALLLWPRSLPRLDVVALHVLGAALVGLLAVVGANVLVNSVHELFGGSGEWRLPILLGMAVAILVFAVVAYGYLRWTGSSNPVAGVGGVVLAVLVIAGLPVLVGLSKEKREDVPTQALVASQVDLLIVTDGSPHPTPERLPPLPTLGQFDVQYSVGVATGNGVRWTLVDEPSSAAAIDALAAGRDLPAASRSPLLRPGADSALLLMADGTPPANVEPSELPAVRTGKVATWKAVVAGSGLPATPVFALLQSTDRGRADEWRRWGRLEDVVAAQEQPRNVTDTALQLAVGSVTAQADLALAMAHRPILLFDQKEPYPVPVAVDSLFREGRITLCDDRGVSTSCEAEPLQSAHGLVNGDTHLRLDLRKPAAATSTASGSTIYVHPVSVDRGRKHLLYLDYWWYLPGNPVDVGGGALCGAGLVIPGITCQSHESDWEGLTVVVDRGGREPRVVGVHYAQHDSVVRYPWDELRERWQAPDVAAVMPPIEDAATRPLAFVARGTHATYPEPCGSGCRQVAAGLGESAHRGNLNWRGNDTVECGESVCLQMLPTRGSGEEPALWNAYTGQWGERHCRFVYYCDSGSPPTAPGNQERYEDPTQYDLRKVPRGPES
jgi:hypothetical protein